jgi:hypothetical protein
MVFIDGPTFVGASGSYTYTTAFTITPGASISIAPLSMGHRSL